MKSSNQSSNRISFEVDAQEILKEQETSFMVDNSTSASFMAGYFTVDCFVINNSIRASFTADYFTVDCFVVNNSIKASLMADYFSVANFMVNYFEVAKVSYFDLVDVVHSYPNRSSFKDYFKVFDTLFLEQFDPNPLRFNQCY